MSIAKNTLLLTTLIVVSLIAVSPAFAAKPNDFRHTQQGNPATGKEAPREHVFTPNSACPGTGGGSSQIHHGVEASENATSGPGEQASTVHNLHDDCNSDEFT